MNETFEKYRFPCSIPQQIFVSRVTEKNNDQTLAIQLILELTEEAPKEQQEGKNV